MTKIEEQMVKNMCSNTASTLFTGITNTKAVVIECTIITEDNNETETHVEVVDINNGV